MAFSNSSGPKFMQSGAAANADGVYRQMILSTTIISKWMMIYIHGGIVSQANALFDVATGGFGSEVEIISDQFYASRNQSGGAGVGSFYSFPMTVPSGTRLSMRLKDSIGGTVNYTAGMTITDQEPLTGAPLIAQSSGKKTVTSAGVITFGAWVELIPSLNESIKWMVLTTYVLTTPTFPGFGFFDLGIGEAGSEVPFMSDLSWFKTLAGGRSNSTGHYFPVVLPAGSRVSIRAKDDQATFNDYVVGILAL